MKVQRTETVDEEVNLEDDSGWNEFLDREPEFAQEEEQIEEEQVAEQKPTPKSEESESKKAESKQKEEESEDQEEQPLAAEQEEDSTSSKEDSETVDTQIDYEKIRQILGQDTADAVASQQAIQQTPEQQQAASQTQSQEGQQQPVAQNEQSEDPQQQMQELREKAQQEIEQRFQLSEDEVDAFREDPNKVMPKLLTKVFFDTYDSLMKGVQGQLPNAVAQVIDMQQRSAEGTQEFYTVWPQLNTPQMRDLVNRIADTYTANNPKVPRSQAIREIGAQAWIAGRLPIDELMKHVEGFSASQQQTQQSEQQKPQKTFRKPANQGQVPKSRVQPRQPANEWDSFIEDVIEEDLT